MRSAARSKRCARASDIASRDVNLPGAGELLRGRRWVTRRSQSMASRTAVAPITAACLANSQPANVRPSRVSIAAISWRVAATSSCVIAIFAPFASRNASKSCFVSARCSSSRCSRSLLVATSLQPAGGTRCRCTESGARWAMSLNGTQGASFGRRPAAGRARLSRSTVRVGTLQPRHPRVVAAHDAFLSVRGSAAASRAAMRSSSSPACLNARA